MPSPSTPVSGRYLGRGGGFEVELRVDVDGARPMHRVSADYFAAARGTTVYSGSICVDEPVVAAGRAQLTITGRARSSWKTGANNVEVTISRGSTGAATHATLRVFDDGGRLRASFLCRYECSAFRRVVLEEDVQPGIERFECYDTGSLPAGCAPRTVSHLSAFADAGIEIVRTREPEILSAAGAATNISWSDAELHAAMVQHFSAFSEAPQWAVWLLHARLHDRDLGAARPSLYGLMFDQSGIQRQGCAVFYGGMSGDTAKRRRMQLFTCVHELGHTFNLLHAFQKTLARPSLPSRPESATWMNYPAMFTGGEDAFWRRFSFEFDDPEVVHLRHAFRNDTIMGGSPLMSGAAFEQDARGDAVQELDPGLRLTLSAQPHVPFGVPVTVDYALSGTTRDGRAAPTHLGPRLGNLEIAIRRPDGSTVIFEPLLRHCLADRGVMLRQGTRPVRDSAFIHYGKNGFAFQCPGRYHVRARCEGPEGMFVWSNVVSILVREPVTRADHAAAELAFGDEQGTLMSLVGSDAPELRNGNDALQTLIERFPRHAVTSVPRLVRATNAAREFKAIRADGSIDRRTSLPQEALELLRGNPGLEALRRAAITRHDTRTPPAAVAELLSRVATDAGSAHVLHPYVRSRIGEISAVIPQVLAPATNTRRDHVTTDRRSNHV